MRKNAIRSRKFSVNAANAVTQVMETLERRTMFSAFTPGDLVVYQVGTIGTGGTALTGVSAAVYADEYTPAGTLVQSINLTTSGANPLTGSTSSTAEGSLSLSQTGQYLMVGGYDAATGVSNIATTSASTATTTGTVSASTAAGTAAVLTVNSTTGMVSGQQITIAGTGVINGTFYLQLQSTTTKIALFTNSTLTTAATVAAGTFTAGTWADSSITTTAREVGIVSATGVVNTATTLGTSLSGTNIRAAASLNGSGGVYAAGPTGIVYTTAGSTSNATSVNTSNVHSLEISGSQLYATGTSTLPIDSIGTGLPTTTATSTILPGVTYNATAGSGVGQPYEFAFATLGSGSSPDTLYIADTYNYGIDKLTYNGSGWAFTSELGGNSSSTSNELAAVTGIAVQPVANGEELYMSTPTGIYSYLDTSGVGGQFPGQSGTVNTTPIPNSYLTTLASVSNGSTGAFRGLAFVPQASLTISTQPISSQTVAAGSNATIFSAVDAGTDATVQWQVNTGSGFTNISNGTLYSGVNSDTLTVLNTATSENGYIYQAVFTSSVDGTATSNSSSLGVIVAPSVTAVSPTSGPLAGGTVVTLTGTLFASGDTVKFGTVAGTSVTVNSATSITVTDPAGLASGVVNVTVTTPASAGSVTSPISTADQFTYLPVPAITSVSPTTLVDSGGNLVTVTGSGFVSGATVAFITSGGTSIAGTGVIVKSATSLTVIAPAQVSGTVDDIVITDNGGISTKSTGDQVTYGLTTIGGAEALPNPTLNVTLDNNPLITSVLTLPGTSANGINYSNGAFLAYDGTGSAEIFGPLPGGYTPTVGNYFTATGGWAPYQQVPELGGSATSNTSISAISNTTGTVSAPAIPVDTISQVNLSTLPNSLAGYLVQLKNVTISGLTGTFGTSNLTGTITDSTGNMTLYYSPSSIEVSNQFFDGLAIPTGPVTLTGLIQVYTSGGTSTAEFVPISEPGTPEKYTIASVSNTSTDDSVDHFLKVSRGNSITIDVNRSASGDNGTVSFSVLNDSATAGVDYTVSAGSNITNYNASSTGITGTITFPAGTTDETFTITTAANPGDYGDKLFTVELSGATTDNGATSSNPTGYLPFIASPDIYTLVIADSNASSTVSENSDNENAIIQPAGAKTTSNTSGGVTTTTLTTTSINVEANNSGNGTSTAYSVLTYDDSGNDPSDVLNDGDTFRTIDGIELETVAAPASYDASGAINIYLVSTTLTGVPYPVLAAPTKLTFDTTHDAIGGVYTQLGTKYLLGTIQYNSTQLPGAYTPYNLTNLDPTGVNILAQELTSGAAFTIVAAPADSTVTATWVGSGGTDLQAPVLRVSYNTALPAWLSSTSAATWITPTHTLAITGAATIISDPGSDEPNPAFVTTGDTLTIASVATGTDNPVHVGSINVSNGATVTMAAETIPQVLVVQGAFNIGSTSHAFDMGANYLDLQSTTVSSVDSLLAAGTLYDSTPSAGSLGTIGAITNANYTGAKIWGSGTALGNFDGSSPGATDVLVRYTYYGDANLNGVVNGDDYTLVDYGFGTQATASPLSGWLNGDFNYDTKIDGSDYTLIDNAFNTQNGSVPVTPSAEIASAFSTASAIPTTSVALPSIADLIDSDKKNTLASIVDSIDPSTN